MTEQERIVTEAIKRLRAGMNQSMVEFAETMGISVSSVVRFESGVIPKRAILKRFAEVAQRNGFVSYHTIFLTYLTASCEDVAEQLDSLNLLAQLFIGELRAVGKNAGLSTKVVSEIQTYTDAALVTLRGELERAKQK